MAGPTPARVEHYLRMFELLEGAEWCVGENLGWTVVRPHHGRLTVGEVVGRLGGDPDAVTTSPPADDGFDDDVVYLEQRGDAVMVVETAANCGEGDVRGRLSRGTTVHGVFWCINNFNRLFRVVDGLVVTELDTLRPGDRSGTDPDALAGHLDALHALHDPPGIGSGRGAEWDWPTALATVESLTGLELDADWFRRPQPRATIR